MNLLLWKEEIIRDPATALARAEAGAAWLDLTRGPGWDRAIDIDRVDVASPFCCILAQLGHAGYFVLPSPLRAVECGFSCGLFMDLLVITVRPAAVVRSYELLSEAWQAVLRRRLARDSWVAARRDVQTAPVNREPVTAA